MESLDQLLGKIVDLLQRPWFHGYMSSDQAEKALKKHRKVGLWFCGNGLCASVCVCNSGVSVSACVRAFVIIFGSTSWKALTLARRMQL